MNFLIRIIFLLVPDRILMFTAKALGSTQGSIEGLIQFYKVDATERQRQIVHYLFMTTILIVLWLTCALYLLLH